jgi:hypothetical protein
MINLNNEPNVDEFINMLNNKELLIYEDIQGSKLYVKFDGDRFIIKPRNIKNDELKFVDIATQKFYNKAFAFFHTLPSYITNIINKNWWFCFEFLPDNKPANIEYNKIPKNNLILTSIVKNGKHKFNYDEILEYSKLFDVDPLTIIFSGILTDKQIEVIRLFLKTKEEDLNFIFGEDNFAKFFYKILNPVIENSYLMTNNNFNDNLEKIIIRIDNDDKYTFEILNPLYKREENENSTEYSHVFSLIVINFLEFLQLKNIETYKPKGLTYDDMYINLICLLFNDYMINIKDDILKWNITVPHNFMKSDKFKINIDFIRNNDTKNYLKIDEKIEYIFKIILGSFNKKRKKPIGVMTENTVILFNKMVEKINIHIEKQLNLDREYRFHKIDLLNFSEYFNMKYDRDGAGNIYPNVKIDFEEEKPSVTKDGKKKRNYTKKK